MSPPGATTRWVAAHQNPDGPGDGRPTAFQIVEDEGLKGRWSEKTVFITGCSSGLGVEAARALHETGATIYATARDVTKAEKALGELTESSRLHILKLDQTSLEDVRRCAAEFNSKCSKLNIFIANAGVMNTLEGRTKDGFETQFGVNHLSHFLLFSLLQPALKAASTPAFNSRVVILSSTGHRWGAVTFDNYNMDDGYHPQAAYAQSKTANLWTANAIERKFAGDGIHAWSIQPGGVFTGLLQHMSEEEKASLTAHPALAKVFKSPEQGASTEVWAATAKCLEGQGGRYLEDCQIAHPVDPAAGPFSEGYGTHAYSPESEKRLWELSLKLTGLA